MLQKLKFDGFLVASSSFNEFSLSDKGFFNISLEDTKYACEKTSTPDEQQIIISFNVILKGFSGDRIEDPQEDDVAFNGKVAISTFYIFEDNTTLNDDFMADNMWFFDNFNQIATKLAVESILKNSNLSFLPIPWNSK